VAEGRPLVVVVRHGETEWSRAGRHTGRTDLELTAAGRRAAAAVGERLADRGFAIALSSPLRRARETAALAGFGGAVVREELFEWDYGGYEGLTTAEIREHEPRWSLWRDGCPGGESPADVGARVDRLIGELRAAPGDVVCFAHGHVLRVLAARWIGLEPADGRLLALDTAGTGGLGWEHGEPVVRWWNARGG
jgi:probable phosphoglycerate mutase